MTENPFYYGCNQDYLNGLVVYVLLSFFPYRTSKLKPSVACTLICAPSSHESMYAPSVSALLGPCFPSPHDRYKLARFKS